MPGAKYEQLSLKSDADEDVFTTKPRQKWSDICMQKSLLSLGLILLYFSLSIGLTFYQRWLLTDFKFPLTVVMYHLIVKWMLSVLVRLVLHIVTRTPQLMLPCMTCLRSVGPTGLASGIDVGFSNWGLELVTISLYTMTKSTTIIFILGFAILLGLEKKSWSLVGIVFMIAAGLIMFTYKATQFNLLGFNFLLLASFAAGLRWTFAQLLMQKSKLGLHNPVDMVFHVQPWMFLSLLPFAIMFEGYTCIDHLQKLSPEKLVPTILKVSVGATIAFAMEISEFLVVTYTSSLTLSISGIFKEMCILVLAVEVSGDVLSPINVVGLAVCLLGIIGHIIHKVLFIKSVAGTVHAIDEDFEPKDHLRRQPKEKGEHDEPLLEDQTWPASEESDFDSNVVLFEVLQRRDGITVEPLPRDTVVTASTPAAPPTKPLPTKTMVRADNDGFTMVQNRKRRQRSNKNRCGTAPMEPNVKIRAAGPNTPVYISRLHYTTKAEDIAEYVRQKLRYTPRLQLLESRRYVNFKAFVVRMPNCMLDQALSESFWPQSVVFRRFRGIVPPERTKS